jgi:hypothetical protein
MRDAVGRATTNQRGGQPLGGIGIGSVRGITPEDGKVGGRRVEVEGAGMEGKWRLPQ